MLNLLNPIWKYLTAFFSVSSLLLGLTAWFQSGQIHRWHVQNDLNVQARANDQAAYRAAQLKAAADNQLHVQQIEQQQQKVTGDVEANYRAQLAQLLSDNQRLREQASSPASPPITTGPSAPVAAPGGPDGQALPLPPAELLQGQECELQLNALIDLVNQQESIDPNAR